METNLINNYINSNKNFLTGPNKAEYNRAQMEARDRENFANLTAKNNMKPLPGKGRLLNSSVLDLPVDFVKGVSYDVKSLKGGLSGNSNDHQLGELNSLGMAAGGLGIASYLYTKKSIPSAKWMEFVGLGSFFASMALWPKLALGVPARIIHGFDIRQKYQDSMGRTKFVYSDPQYIPWDLYSDKEINKIGDRLHVSKDIPNRRDFIQEKMKKIALQNNTLWMLTAGFATPIMSALICNKAEQMVRNAQARPQNSKADDMLKNLDAYAQKQDTSKYRKRLESLLKANKNKPFDAKLAEKIAKAMSFGLDPQVAAALKADLSTEEFINNGVQITADEVEFALQNIPANASRFRREKDAITKVMPKPEEIIEQLKQKNLMGRALNADELKSARSIIVKSVVAKLPTVVRGWDEACEGAFLEDITAKLLKDLGSNNACRLSEDKINAIRTLAGHVEDFYKKSSVIDAYRLIKVADEPEVIIANKWNDITSSFIKIFNITPKDIELNRFDREHAQQMFRSKLEAITSDDNKYKDVISKLAEQVKTLDDSLSDSHAAQYEKTIDEVFNKAAVDFSSLGLNELSEKLVSLQFRINDLTLPKSRDDYWMGEYRNKLKHLNITEQEAATVVERFNTIKAIKDPAEKAQKLHKLLNEVPVFNFDETGSLKRLQKAAFQERLAGVRNTFYRMINTLDLYRRVSKADFAGALPNSIPREVREEIIELSKQIMLQGHAVDYSTKFYFERNLHPSSEGGDIKVVKGAVENAFYKPKADGVQRVEIPSDLNFFKRVMRFMYGNTTQDGADYGHEMDKATQDALKDKGLFDKIQNYNRDFYFTMGNETDVLKPNIKVSGDAILSSPGERFLKVAKAPDELVTKLVQDSFNTGKWKSMFIGLGIGLLGVTVASQFLFGKLRSPQNPIKQNQQRN